MDKTNINNKNRIVIADELVRVKYLRGSNSGRIKKGDIRCVNKANANHLVRYRIAILV